MVLCCARGFCSVVIFFSIMISLSSAPPETYQTNGVSNPELLSQPLLNAIFQAVPIVIKKTYIRSWK